MLYLWCGFFFGGKKKKRRSMLAWRSPLIESPSHWQVSDVESSDNGASLSTRRTGCGCGHAPWLCLPALIWAGLKRHCLSFHAARNHSCASPWIEGCAICKIPKDNFIYSCCNNVYTKFIKYVTRIDLSQPISSITNIYVIGSVATIILYAVEYVVTRDSPWQLYER